MQHIENKPYVNREFTGATAAAKGRTPFLKLYGDDFLSGCRKAGMTPEQVGAYIFMLVLEWQDKAPLEDDMRVLSVRTGWDVRTVRRIVNSLVQLGKYDRDDGLLRNQRMQEEIETYIAKVKAKKAKIAQHCADNEPTLTEHYAVNEATLTPDLSEKANKNKGRATKKPLYARRALDSEPETDSLPTTSVAARTSVAAALPSDDQEEYKKLSERLLTACNGALDNPVNCMGLLNLQVPQMWIDEGADLEKDILPTLTAAGKKYHGKRIRTWEYFTSMVMEAVSRRLAGLPKIDLTGSRRQREAEERSAMLKAQNEALRKEYGFDKEVPAHG